MGLKIKWNKPIFDQKNYSLTFQKHMSGFKTHRTSPAAKVINVWIVLIVMMTFMNVHYDVLHVE